MSHNVPPAPRPRPAGGRRGGAPPEGVDWVRSVETLASGTVTGRTLERKPPRVRVNSLMSIARQYYYIQLRSNCWFNI